MSSQRQVIVAVTTFTAALCACSETGPTPVTRALTVDFVEPVVARFVSATNTMIAEFPVTVSDPDGPGGSLSFIETVVVNRSRGILVASNRRPNVSYTFDDVRVPPRGALTVQAGVGFAPPPPRDEIVITVRTRLDDGRAVERTAVLAQEY